MVMEVYNGVRLGGDTSNVFLEIFGYFKRMKIILIGKGVKVVDTSSL